MLTVAWTDPSVGNDKFNLKKVDKTNKKYTRYADKRTRHGTCGYRLDFRVWEDDAFIDDEVALWRDVYVGTFRILTPSEDDGEVGDARLRVTTTSDYSDDL